MNHDKNYEYSQELSGDKKLDMPVSFHGEYDFVGQTVNSTLAEPMRKIVQIWLRYLSNLGTGWRRKNNELMPAL